MQKRVIIVILVLGLVGAGGFLAWKSAGGSGGASVAEPPRPDDISGLESMVRDAIDDAVAAVDQAPEDSDARAALGMVYHAHDLYDHAIAAYEQSLTLRDAGTKVRYLLADAQTRRGSLDDAIATYERLEADGWTYAPGSAAYGRLLLDVGRPRDAAAAFRRAMQLDQTNAASYVGLARVALMEDRNDDAVKTLQSLLTSGINVPYVHHLLGMALQRLGRTEEAAVHASLSDGTRPGWPDEWQSEMRATRTGYRALLEGAEAKIASNDFMEAIRDLETLRAQHPDDVTLLNYLAQAYIGAGFDIQAEAALNDALERDPKSVSILVNLSLYHERKGNLNEALRHAQNAVDAHPENGPAQLQLGRVQVLAKDNAGAAQSLQTALRLGTGGEPERAMFTSVLMALGRWDDAERTADQLVQRYPGSVNGWTRMVQICIQRGRLVKARESLETLRRISQDQAMIQQLTNALARAERQRGG